MTRWIGREKLKRRLLKLPQEAQQKLRTEFAAGAQDIVAMQKRLVAVDGGDLRDSITWNWGDAKKIAYSQGDSAGGPLSIRISAGNTRVRYAHIVEFGAAPHVAGGIFKGAKHPGAPAQPFFYPAYRAKKKAFKSRQRRAFRKAIAASRGA
jgi:HK97 gp10 family phage protein